jgi:hypothetical protein
MTKRLEADSFIAFILLPTPPKSSGTPSCRKGPASAQILGGQGGPVGSEANAWDS